MFGRISTCARGGRGDVHFVSFFMQGMVALAGAQTLLKQFEVSAKVALKAPLDRNVKKPLVLEGFSMRAGADFQHFWMRKWCVFICFLDIAS